MSGPIRDALLTRRAKMAQGDRPESTPRVAKELTELRAEVAALRARNALLEAVVETINDAVFAKDQDGRYLLINAAGAELHGKTPDEITGRHDLGLFGPDDFRSIAAVDREILAEGTIRTFVEELSFQGRPQSRLVTKGPYRDAQGRIIGVIGISRDFTERNHALEALRETREFLFRLLDCTPAPIWVVTAEGRFRLVNRAWEERFRHQCEEIIGRHVADIIPAELAARFLDQNRSVVAAAAPMTFEEEVEAGGEDRAYHTFKFPLSDSDDQIEAIGGIAIDVTDRKRAERALEESRVRLQAIFDNTLDAIWLFDSDGRVVDANPAMCALLGYDRREFLGMLLENVTPRSHHDQALAIWGTMLAEGGLRGEFRLICKDGSTREVAFHAVANILPGLHMSANQDISEHKRAEALLEESRQRLQAIFDNTTDAILLFGRERIIDANPTACALLGYEKEELLGKTAIDLTPGSAEDRLREVGEVVTAKGSDRGEFTLVRKDGSTAEVEYHAVGHILPDVHLSVKRDISSRKRADRALLENAEQLRLLSRSLVEVQEAERLNLARELHDEVGQLLTVIGINLQTIKKSSAETVAPQIDECVGVVDLAIHQVRNLSLDLRPPMLDDLGLVTALRWFLDRQARQIGYVARFDTDPNDVELAPPIAIAAFRVAQEALTNVARHARARLVRVRLRASGGRLRLLICDDGVGFDPVAALRGAARGSGLGLLGIRERAALLGGRVRIRSSPGRGNAIRMTVPLERT